MFEHDLSIQEVLETIILQMVMGDERWLNFLKGMVKKKFRRRGEAVHAPKIHNALSEHDANVLYDLIEEEVDEETSNGDGEEDSE